MRWLPLLVILPLGIATSYVLNRRLSARIYERNYGHGLRRRWSLVLAVGVWLLLVLMVGLVALFPDSGWIIAGAFVVIGMLVGVPLIFRINRGFKADPANPPHGVFQAIARGGRKHT